MEILRRNKNKVLIGTAFLCGLLLLILCETDGFSRPLFSGADKTSFWEAFVFLAVSMILSYEDAEKRTIKNRWILFGILFYFVFHLIIDLICGVSFSEILKEFWTAIWHSGVCVIPILLLTVLLEKIFHHTILGGGDFKYLLMAGLYMNLLFNIFGILMGFVLAALKLLIQYLRKKKTMTLPMIPCFTAGYFVVWTIAGQMIMAYFGN